MFGQHEMVRQRLKASVLCQKHDSWQNLTYICQADSNMTQNEYVNVYKSNCLLTILQLKVIICHCFVSLCPLPPRTPKKSVIAVLRLEWDSGN